MLKSQNLPLLAGKHPEVVSLAACRGAAVKRPARQNHGWSRGFTGDLGNPAVPQGGMGDQETA